MWVFTEVADWFDRTRVENQKYLDQTFQGWIDYAVAHEDDPGFASALRNVAIYGGTGTLYALNQFATTVASGFLDTLRIGDGLRKGGWGYAQDTVRLLALAPLLRYARFGLAQFVTDPGEGLCTWVAARAALIATGTRHFITLGKVLDSAGVTLGQLPEYAGAWTEEAGRVLQLLGADVTTVQAAGPVEKTLLALIGDNVNSKVIFSVKWPVGAAQEAGHTMVAFRNALTGTLQILDRSGKIVHSLAELESSYPPGISNAVFYETAEAPLLLVKNSIVVTTLDNGLSLAVAVQASETWVNSADGSGFMFTNARWIYHALGLEVRSVPFRVETHTSLDVPVRAVLAKGSLSTQTTCIPTLVNSEVAPDASARSCDALTVYTVQSGDTLSGIAQLSYGDPNRWRGIAVANRIADPTKLKPGTILAIP